jgi:hypothetical protein
LFSHLYAGNKPNNPAYIPTLLALDAFLGLPKEAKCRTILRTDAGFGSDDNIDYALDEDWQYLGKGFSGSRAKNLAIQVASPDWEDLGHQRWVAKPSPHPSYVCPVQYLLLRWLTTQGMTKYASVICSILEWTPAETIQHYDDRGGCETEIQADKGGLKMCKRRKLHLEAQEALILLTDLAHNLIAWNSAWMFPVGPLATFGTTRLIEDVFSLNGRLIFRDESLIEVHLNENHPYAEDVAEGLQCLLDHFGL